MRPHKINSENLFIAGWYNDDFTICNKLIDYYHGSSIKNRGKSIDITGEVIVDDDSKKSIDCPILDRELGTEYLTYLQASVHSYVEKYPFSNYYLPWTVVENFHIQHYLPGNSFNAWHTERGVSNTMYRHLVFMTYLNDVNQGGETEFLHQQIKIKPEKGLTLIWPSDWTFTHRGLPAFNENKFIITGWFSYTEIT